MSIKVQDAGTLRTIKAAKMPIAGVERRFRTAKLMDGATLRTVAVFADPLTASASPTSVSGWQSSTGPITVTTSATSAIPGGGLAPFTYSWARLSGYTATANSPTSATTNFSASVSPGSEQSIFRVTVTDAVGQTATADVEANFINSGDLV